MGSSPRLRPRYECIECPAAFEYHAEAVDHVRREHCDPSDYIVDRLNLSEGP